MKRSRLLILGVLLGGLVAWTGCGLDESSQVDPDGAFTQMTVIDAVQLGAAQSCHSAANTVSGNLTIRRLKDGDGLQLLLEDGDPVCIDTMDNIAVVIEVIEETYIEDVGSLEAQQDLPDDLRPLILTTGTDKPSDSETDPNPQPALETGVKLTTTKTAIKPGTPLPDKKPSPNPDNPPDNPSETD